MIPYSPLHGRPDIPSMTPGEFQRFLHRTIPPAHALGIEVVRFGDDEVRMRMPIGKNHNDKLTAFGGSIGSLFMLCGWARVLRLVRQADPAAEAVIARSSITYKVPVTQDFEVSCAGIPPEDARLFLERYLKRGRSRIELYMPLVSAGAEAAVFHGTYLAYRAE